MNGAPAGDGLARWLLGGLVGGAIVLGLLVGAYAIGYQRGQDNVRSASPAAPAAATTSGTPTSTGAGAAAGPAAHGEKLFVQDGCSGCHSLDGTPGAGPTVKGLAGSRVELDDGSTTTADNAYLTKAIADPDAEIVKGYQKGVMSGATASFGLGSKPDDVAALVAFIEKQR